MRKYVRAYLPFLVYFVCVAFAYFIFFYLLPKYDVGLGLLGLLVIYSYICFGVFFFGYFMGKIIVIRTNCINIWQCLLYALISFFLMLLIGSLKDIFGYNMYGNFSFTFSGFIDSLSDTASLLVSFGTLIPFLIGEFVAYRKIYFSDNK